MLLIQWLTNFPVLEALIQQFTPTAGISAVGVEDCVQRSVLIAGVEACSHAQRHYDEYAAYFLRSAR